jgi:hypothetical protein
MKKKIPFVLPYSFLAFFFVIGCTSPNTPDAQGWRESQKQEFLQILSTDQYLSLCNQTPLYEKVKQSEDSFLMSRLLVAYTKNLANSCIDLKAFESYQEKRQEAKIATNYEIYLQQVKPKAIISQLKAGALIKDILKPYVPQYKAFDDLRQRYTALEKSKNQSPDTLRSVRLNIERIKLMKPHLGETYVLVNIPEYMVRVVEENQTKLMMRVIVGQKKLQTPVFSAPLQYIGLNPTWRVPDSIAKAEVIPHLIADPEYLKKERLVVRKSYEIESTEVDPSSINWADYLQEEKDKAKMTYKFIEVPSERNVLGRVKFLFPNAYDVYMHDTQTKNLFNRQVRTFSHGCIRLQKPIEMLTYLSKNYTTKSEEEIQKFYRSMKTKFIPFNKQLPVHTAYLTAYVNESGKLLLLHDIYGFDRGQKLTF